jgi:hypothetical protein
MNITPRLAATALPLACALCACVDSRYYVKTDNSNDVLNGVSSLRPPEAPPAPMSLGTTFKSDGKVLLDASNVLYQAVSQNVGGRGQWQVQRLGRADADFGPVIAAIITQAARAAGAPPVPGQPQLLVLVENRPDLSAGIQIDYFFAGMSLGLHRVARATDRYDVTVAYRDPAGLDHVYRNHQDLLTVAGSGTEPSVAGLKQYQNPSQAFHGIVSNTIAGSARGTVRVGTPKFQPTASTAPAAAPPPPAH